MIVRSAVDTLIFSDVAAAIGGGVTTIGGFPPVAYAISFIQRAIGHSPTPRGGASAPQPSGRASNPKPER